MNDNTLIERQKKFELSKGGSLTTRSLARMREDSNLELRKNKLFSIIMRRRLRRYNEEATPNSNELDTYEMELNTSDTDQTLAGLVSYENSESFLKQIMKIFNENMSQSILNSINQGEENQNIQEGEESMNIFSNSKIKFALLALRKYLSIKEKKLNDEEANFLCKEIYNYIIQIFLSEIEIQNYINDKNKTDNSKVVKSSLKMKYEASWIIINLTAENDIFCRQLIDIRVLTTIEQMLGELLEVVNTVDMDISGLIRHIFWILANILGENSSLNQIVKNTINLPEKIFKCFKLIDVSNIFNKSNFLLIQVLLWTLNNFLMYTFSDTKYQYSEFLIQVFQVLKIAYENSLQELYKEAIHTVSIFSNCLGLVQTFIDYNAVPLLINGLSMKDVDNLDESQLEIITIFSDLLTSTSEEQLNYILQFPIIEKLCDILFKFEDDYATKMIESNKFDYDYRLCKILCLTLANVTGGPQQYIEKIILNPRIIDTLRKNYEYFGNSVKYEILFIFYNAFYMGDSLIQSELISLNCHRLFIEMLKQIMSGYKGEEKNLTPQSIKTIVLILDTFLLCLEYGSKVSSKMNYIQKEMELEDIPQLLTVLQFDMLSEIYDRAHKILIRYWSEDELYYQDPKDLMNLR